MRMPSEGTSESPPPVRRHAHLDPQPQSAAQARTVVSELLADCNLEDLSDTATLLVSELVTNAVLHTATPIDLRCHVEEGILCVQVGDRSPVLPGMRHYDDDAMTGRGLGMVELLSAAWGVEGDESGKTVWFQLAPEGVEPDALPPVPEAGHEEWKGARFDVRLLGVPAALLATTVQHGDSMLRELALTSIAAETAEQAPSWSASRVDLGPLLDAVEAARRHDGTGQDPLQRHDTDTVDVTVSFPAGAGSAAYERLALLDEGDRMARDRELLSPPSLPEVAVCRRWVLSQIGLQEEGSEPARWELPNPLPPSLEPARLPDGERRALDDLARGAVVADDANRIIYVNGPAAELLGWETGDLIGQRLVSIVPPELREAHLAGFGRYLITAEPRLLDRAVRVPALRRDGSRVQVEVTITEVDVGGGRTAFKALLAEVVETSTPPQVAEENLPVRAEVGAAAAFDDLNDAGRALAGAESLDALLRVVTHAARSLIGTHRAATSRLEHDWGPASTHVSLSDAYAADAHIDAPLPGHGVLDVVTKENRPLRLNRRELAEHPEWRGLQDAPGRPPLPDLLAAPLMDRRGSNIGLIQLSGKQDGSTFTEADEALLVQLAQMASATLEHVELLERERAARHQLEERAREARLAAAVGMALTSDSSLQVQLHLCAQALVDHLDAAFGRIWTLDAAGEVLVLQASAGMYTHLDGDHARVPVGDYKIGRIAARRQPHLTNDVANDEEISDPAWAAREGMVAFAGYPLIVKGHVIGVLALFARRSLPDSTLEALAAVTDVIAVGIEQSRATDELQLRAGQMRRVAQTAARMNAADGLEAILSLVTEEARGIIGARRSVSTLTQEGSWGQALTTVSLSDEYEIWRDYDENPDGSGVYALVCEEQRPLRLTQAELEAHPRWRALGEVADEHPPIRGWLAAPLTAPDGSNFGLLQLSDKEEGEFTEEDEAILVQLAEIVSSAVHKRRLYEDRARVAAVLQQSLLPPMLPSIPGMEIAARYRAGTEDVGGDFYDVFPLRGRAWGVVIGDVRGKGPQAAALTALARHSTRAAAMSHRRPHKVLAVTNEALHDNVADPERFCSAAFLRAVTGDPEVRIELASGGHPPLLVVRTDGEVERLDPTGPLLGLFPEIDLTSRKTQLAPGEVLVAYTDGITEARRGDRLFGTYGLTQLLTAHRGDDVDTIADAIIDAAAAFSDRVEDDDAAVIVLRAEAPG